MSRELQMTRRVWLCVQPHIQNCRRRLVGSEVEVAQVTAWAVLHDLVALPYQHLHQLCERRITGSVVGTRYVHCQLGRYLGASAPAAQYGDR
jgi:hypothetical protein